MVVDLSLSMGADIGKNDSKRDVSIAEAAMCMCAILIQGCRDGGHTFSIAGYGTRGGNYTVSPLDVDALTQESSRSFWQDTANSTRLIWGGDAQQRKDYEGARDSIVNSVSSENSSELWSYMGGTNSGCGMARMYYYMKEKMKGTEVRTAPCIFLSDCYPSDLDVPPDCYEEIDGDPQKPKLDTKRMSEKGREGRNSAGFWYWAKKYSQEFGPVILIQMLNDRGWESVQNNEGYLARLNAAFVQFLGEGYPASEYEKCFLSLKVVMTPQGGNLIDVAMRLNEFIKNMNGEGEICCGGKGISF